MTYATSKESWSEMAVRKLHLGLVATILVCMTIALVGCGMGGGSQTVSAETGDELQLSWGDGWSLSEEDTKVLTKQDSMVIIRFLASDDFDRNLAMMAKSEGGVFSDVTKGADSNKNRYVDATYSDGTRFRLLWVTDSSTGVLLSTSADGGTQSLSAISFKCNATVQAQNKGDVIDSAVQ